MHSVHSCESVYWRQGMTFNEARAALAIGCKVHLPGYLIKIISIGDTEITYSSITQDSVFTVTISDNLRNATNWEIYHENQRSSTSS